MSIKKALLVIDVQVALFLRKQYDGKALMNEEQLLSNISKLIERARATETPVIYIQHTESEGYLAIGSPLWEIHSQIKPASEDTVIQKYYSDSFYETTLHETLDALGIKHLVIAGLQTEYCVDTTCRTAFSLGYKNILVSDGHSTYDSETLSASQIIEHHNEIIGSLFAELKKTEEIEF